MKFAELQDKLIKILGRKVTQKEIADALQLDKSSITKYIQRDSELNLAHILYINRFFNVDLEKEINNIQQEKFSELEITAIEDFMKALKGDLKAYKSVLNKLKGVSLLYGFIEEDFEVRNAQNK